MAIVNSSSGISQNFREKIYQSLNGHNAKVFSGIEQIFVVQLSEWDKIRLIAKYYKAAYYRNEFTVHKLAFNDFRSSIVDVVTDKEVEFGSRPEDQLENEKLQADSERLFENAWVIPINPNKSKFNVKTQGEQKGKSYISEVTAFVNGAGRISVEFFNSLLDYEIAVIFKDSNHNYRILFDPVYSVETDVEQDSGEGLTSTAGFTVTFKCQSKLPPLYFYGRIKLTSGFANPTGDGGQYIPMADILTSPRPDSFLKGQADELSDPHSTKNIIMLARGSQRESGV